MWQTDAYFQAITEGLIEKNTTDDLFDEQVEAAQRVADIFRSKWSKEGVLKQWFEKKKL